jgi:hypothetical protein
MAQAVHVARAMAEVNSEIRLWRDITRPEKKIRLN